MAAAVLLLELERADAERAPAERERLSELLRAHYGLADAELDALIEQAGVQAGRAVSLHDFIHALNAELTPDDKRTLMEMLWRVAHADGRIDPHEEHLLRRIADLLYIEHRDFIRAKLRVVESGP
ncbi:MAG: TerB family tellurite resistance protein [Gammaproteobacteria bacterium]|nr:TerB family tellurite resistance protein [Gammaproteobacteria bacterium]